MFSWKDVLAQQERVADLYREAEKDRLAQQALAQNGRAGQGRRQFLDGLRRLFERRRHAARANVMADRDAAERLLVLERLDQSQERITECN